MLALAYAEGEPADGSPALRDAPDAARVLNWRNDDPPTQRCSVNKNGVAPDEHRAWLAARLADQTPCSGSPCAAMRRSASFACRGAGRSRRSLSRSPPSGAGWGCPMVQAGVIERARARLGVRRAIARIDPANEASRRAFTEAGFTPASSADEQIMLETMIER